MEINSQSFVVVANRLPVDATITPESDGSTAVRWHPAPGGLVTAMDAVMRHNPGAWVGWCGTADLELDPFTDDAGRMLVPVTLTAEELREHYEGFSNGSLWPLYHDGVAPPEYHREWWATYEEVNRRFADAAAAAAAEGATVWVHDYQLQLVPALLREQRPDLRIGFFLHIPVPPFEIFRQIPWRRQILIGLLGADLIGFQRRTDASNFRRTLRMQLGMRTHRTHVLVPGSDNRQERRIRAEAFPISIDSHDFEELARSTRVQERAAEIRRELGNPDTVLLGVDRLDYTKGIRHRLRAVGELLEEGRLDS
ncbi:MAG: trehalose-6-phosphate synthase, partial [Actinomycetes bacterium]|nr:trehalose-6-phosphate synthase [Actinomycetes bacterium]MDX5379737.1 trehalose-6-phosphate synthase [Actinomycetes bacterium]MDX5398138.1 trehalose-6-phosphate synthase [Actinomycetes bacterium]MDX5449434.1 trehalose-6-phosphate synthase [Actinomycetes bacterium]